MTTADDYEVSALVHFMSGPARSTETMDARQIARRRRTIKATSRSLHTVMNADDPPLTREEAIRRAIGFLGMLFASLFPQYSLAIRVAGFLWDVFHQGK